jgi:hypothetical protein
VFDIEGLEIELATVAESLETGVLVVPPVEYEPDDDERTQRAHWVAALALAMSAGAARAPITLVLLGVAGSLAPAVGFSQRAARRLVNGYILVDAELPRVDGTNEDWPDAPVIYVHSPEAHALNVNQAQLRGWDTIEIPDTSSLTVTDTVVQIAGTL